MKKTLLITVGFMAIAAGASAQKANGSRAQQSTTTTTVVTAEKATTVAAESEDNLEVDKYGNRRGTPEFEEARKAEKLRLEEKKKQKALKEN
ncbi:MAG TPA: hypothetical protein PLE75_09695 [Ferruginibacter sp.]|nr:hypothetical protein [Chitinophagaceae bacterium]HML58246.1 hypothetical protein [Ferruginibacter sp.]HRN91750.1 hypothetical protein [Ferruginibacter sp.]HRO06946.1 hypothetical protein [Ferruginibacter sp.]HRO95731.1 hypothetical protein [Ferruginibacter sp.]